MYITGEGVLVSDMDNCHRDEWNWLIKLAKVLRWLRSQQSTSIAPQTNISLSKLCFPSLWAPASFWTDEKRPRIVLCCSWGAASASSKMQAEREKPQFKPYVQIQQQNSRKSMPTAPHRVSGQRFSFLLFESKAKPSKVHPSQRLNFATRYF